MCKPEIKRIPLVHFIDLFTSHEPVVFVNMEKDAIVGQALAQLPKELHIEATWDRRGNGTDGQLLANINGKVVRFNADKSAVSPLAR
jgi:hypothetical protein